MSYSHRRLSPSPPSPARRPRAPAGSLARAGAGGLLALLAALAPALVAACSASPGDPKASPLEMKRPGISGPIHYDVTPRESGARLSVIGRFPAGLPAEFHVDRNMIRWVRDPEIETASGWSKLPFDGETWNLAACAQGCRVRYQYDLGAAARETADVGYAAVHGEAYLAPPSTWLLHPATEMAGVPYEFHVDAAADTAFVTGVFPTAGAAGASYGADISDLPDSPYSAFGKFEALHLSQPKAAVDVAVVNSPYAAGNNTIVKWIEESGRAVSAYYGRFPLSHAAIFVLIEGGSDMGYATTLGNGGGAIVTRIGRDLPEARLLRSWQMTHEMLHLAFPNLPRENRWFEEGMATYVEPIARARVGALSEEAVWRALVKGLFFAQPMPGEGGLDDTPTWGRTYWGGALFCFLADVRIREQTGNARSLDDALRAVLDQGGNAGARWDLGRVLDVGDRATGTTVLRELHAEMGHSAVTVDLAELWARLGVQSRGGDFVFDDGAPLANIRKSITAAAGR